MEQLEYQIEFSGIPEFPWKKRQGREELCHSKLKHIAGNL
jgi:hypothetical protein